MSESKLSPSLASRDLVFHVWPKYGDALSFDAVSVAALLYVQLALPGQFAIAYCANPDLSPTGQLPFLTHGLYYASGLSPIVAYVRKLRYARELDAGLSPVQAAQLTARIAHVESCYGDLVNHMLYSLQDNWAGVTRPALVSMLPVPQRYYVPNRLRASHKTRLQAVELWDVPEDEEEEEEEQRRVVFGRRKKFKLGPTAQTLHCKKSFEREKVVEKAKALFEVYDKLLGDYQFFNGSEIPTTLDVVFAAHTHMLLKLALPDSLVTTALDSYPRLVSHCHAVLSAAFPPNVPFPPTIQQNWLSSLRCLIPWPRTPTTHRSASTLATSPEAQQIERRYRLWRWGLIAGSVLATTGYIWFGVAMLLAQNGEFAARLRAAASGEPAAEPAPEADDEDDEE
ncbi:uncharacterized protein TRAVEDRAFT_145706 [Trametes versicolor FP-101664 SS1]|uniref:uncharacterized protein n=1 Tax=Trametes versicolor (strain FP-101664) TaxID=717944 RepID=UPI0004621812|nr:uncharacterized protein TRAVEDRAFT_145706 [Trametes versicolor FP-101664 SS1]EIW60369.1 hypothetical protein TRAVEDRAFT_145706 [Trametes versicolor FP-101664 SS1]